MVAKNIDTSEFREAIKVAFTNDPLIFSLYCPNVKIETVADIVKDISSRINADENGAIIKGVYDKNMIVGYYVYQSERKALISFGLNIGYRKRKYLKELFAMIRNDLKGKWQAFLWSRNSRAIKWLQKNGAKIVAADNLLTHLIY